MDMTSLKERRQLTVAEARQLSDLVHEVINREGKVKDDAPREKVAMFRQLCARAESPSERELTAEVQRLVAEENYEFVGWCSGSPCYGCTIAGKYFYLSRTTTQKIPKVTASLDSEYVERTYTWISCLCPDANLERIGMRLSPEFAARLHKKL